MQFQVPQFIEVEDRILGPLSLKQLMYIVGAGAISFMTYFIFSTWLWMIVTAVVGALGFALALVKYNGQPLTKILEAAFVFIWNPRLYLWQREEKKTVFEIPEIKEEHEKKVISQRKAMKEFFSEMPSVKKLMQDMVTTKNPIPKREKKLPTIHLEDRFELFRKHTGAKEVAKRVDYR